MLRLNKIIKNFAAVAVTILILTILFAAIVRANGFKTAPEKKKVYPKMESVLYELAEKYKNGQVKLEELAKKRAINIKDKKKITVFLISEIGKTADAIARKFLRAYGAQIIKSGDKVIKANVPVNKLKQIAANVRGISFIKLPDKPLPLEFESEGVSLTGASSFHSYGYTGSGVKVAIIDLGFAGLSSAISAGELPDNVVKIDCTGESCASTAFSSETDAHGTSVAEIVHDMAPDAQLYLIKEGDILDLKNGKDYCISNGIKIINFSVGGLNENFYSGECYNDNKVCTANDAYSNGILWVNSAGNAANKHYEATFTDSNNDTWHDVPGYNDVINLNANDGETIGIYLTWDAWPATNQDFDLYLYNSSLTQVASSINSQGGTPPAESISYSVPSSGTYNIKIKKFNATSNPKLELYSFNHQLTPAVASSSLMNPADAANVMAVGAISYLNWTTGPQESFSSQGPANDDRSKPDISGPDGVSTSTYGSGGFFGTSASSPHVAGAAALALSKHPTYSVSQLWNALINSATDIGTAGQDNIYGYGKLNFPSPTAITLSNFIVKPADKKIVLEWNTETEGNNTGFNILRSESKDKGYIRINDSLIPGTGDFVTGLSYSFNDENTETGKLYFYKLEDIDIFGNSTMHGPFSAEEIFGEK